MAAYRFCRSHGASWMLEARLYVTVKAGRQVQVMRQALGWGKMSLRMSLPDPETARPWREKRWEYNISLAGNLEAIGETSADTVSVNLIKFAGPS